MTVLRTSRVLSMAATVTLGTGALPVTGQDVLGDGQLLDSSLQVGSGGRNRSTNIYSDLPNSLDYDLRNLIVTRNVAAGRGFRGSVGYAAADDFRADTGSDDLFRFRARSALSQLSYITSDAARSGPLTIGQAMGIVEYRRGTRGATLDSVNDPLDTYGESLMLQSRLNDLALTESSFNRADDVAQGRLLSVHRSADGSPFSIRASEARGLRPTDVRSDLPMYGLTAYDQARLIQDMQSGVDSPQVGQSFDETQEEISEFEVVEGMIQPEPLSADAASVVSTDYRDIVAGVAQQLAGTTHRSGADLAADMKRQMESFRELLADMDDARSEDTLPGTMTNVPVLPGVEQPAPVEAPAARQQPAEDLDIASLRHGQTVTSLTPENTSTRFAEIMKVSEELLRSGSFFQAEREFSRALRFQQFHPLAMAGLANAQLGAGLRVAAGVSVRNLYTRHPEMIDATFAPELLPPRERLDEIVQILSYQIDSGQAATETALLFAYIGSQTEQHELITKGLKCMQELDRHDPLPIVLRGVWLEEDVEAELESLRN